MKPKYFSKKLILNKKTVANLDKREMKNVEGGAPPFTNKTWCDGSCMVPIGGGTGCLTIYPDYCVCEFPR